MPDGYDPDSYWEGRGGPAYQAYVESPEYAVYHRAQAEFFARLVNELRPATLLDFGCGSGKLFDIWRGIPEVHGYDRARSQVAVARREAQRLCPDNPYHILHYASTDRTRLPYDDGYFDMVVSAEVLLHILPLEIDAMIGELHRVCGDRLALVTAAPFTSPAPHNFNHDYSALLHGRFTVTDDHVLHRQRYIVGRKCLSGAHARLRRAR